MHGDRQGVKLVGGVEQITGVRILQNRTLVISFSWS
jgi:hypothetical protein